MKTHGTGKKCLLETELHKDQDYCETDAKQGDGQTQLILLQLEPCKGDRE